MRQTELGFHSVENLFAKVIVDSELSSFGSADEIFLDQISSIGLFGFDEHRTQHR